MEPSNGDFESQLINQAELNTVGIDFGQVGINTSYSSGGLASSLNNIQYITKDLYPSLTTEDKIMNLISSIDELMVQAGRLNDSVAVLITQVKQEKHEKRTLNTNK